MKDKKLIWVIVISAVIIVLLTAATVGLAMYIYLQAESGDVSEEIVSPPESVELTIPAEEDVVPEDTADDTSAEVTIEEDGLPPAGPAADEDVDQVAPIVEEDATPMEELLELASRAETVDPETFVFHGCGMIHGPDSGLDVWRANTDDRARDLLTFYEEAEDIGKTIYLDYEEPNDDEVWIVACTCDEYNAITSRARELRLNFQWLVWHVLGADGSDQRYRMSKCLDGLPIR